MEINSKEFIPTSESTEINNQQDFIDNNLKK